MVTSDHVTPSKEEQKTSTLPTHHDPTFMEEVVQALASHKDNCWVKENPGENELTGLANQIHSLMDVAPVNPDSKLKKSTLL